MRIDRHGYYKYLHAIIYHKPLDYMLYNHMYFYELAHHYCITTHSSFYGIKRIIQYFYYFHIDEISLKDIIIFRKQLMNEELSASVINATLKGLNDLFEYALILGLLKANPVKEVLSVANKENYAYKPSIDEIRTILKAIDESDYKEVLNFILYTGIRKSELFHIKHTDVDLEKNIVYITHPPKVRTLYLSLPTKEIIENIYINNSHHYLFFGDDLKIEMIAFNKELSRIKKDYHLYHFNYNTLIHLFSYLYIECDGQLPGLMDYLGVYSGEAIYKYLGNEVLYV